MTPGLACLALTVYFEARSEPVEAQLEVAHVVLERVAQESWPDDICSVVFQGGEQLHLCQFSWYCDGRPDTPAEPDAWSISISVARTAILVHDDGDEWPTHYHAEYASPFWAPSLRFVGRKGIHLFYR